MKNKKFLVVKHYIHGRIGLLWNGTLAEVCAFLKSSSKRNKNWICKGHGTNMRMELVGSIHDYYCIAEYK